MAEYVTPGVYFEWTDESARRVLASRTDIAAFIGVAERGPLNVSTRIVSWTQFQTMFGNFIPNGYLAYAVKAFFENGGRECRVIRVAARLAEVNAKPDTATQATFASIDGFVAGAVLTARQKRTAKAVAPQPADRASVVVAATSAFVQGALVKATQGALIAFRHVRDASATGGSTRIAWDSPLDAAFNMNADIDLETTHQVDALIRSAQNQAVEWEPALPAQFDLAAFVDFETGVALDGGPGAGSGVMLGEDNKPTLKISAKNPGAWGNDLTVGIARTNSAATRTARAPQPADRLSSAVESVANFPIGAVVRIFQNAAPNPIVRYQAITGVDARNNRLAWNQPLDVAFDLVAAQTGIEPLSVETVEFSLSVYEAGNLKEVFSGLSLFPEPHSEIKTFPIEADQRNFRKMHAQNVVNHASKLIAIEDARWQENRTDLFESLPNPAAANLVAARLRLIGGRDGIAALRPRDFVGDAASTKLLGLRALEKDDAPAMICIPDAVMRAVPARRKHIPPPPPKPDPCLPPFVTPPADMEPPVGWFERSHEFTLDEIERIEAAMIAHCELHRYRMALLDPPLFGRGAEIIELGNIQGWRKRFDSTYAALNFPWLLVNDPLRVNGEIVRRVPPSGHAAGIYAQSDFAQGVWGAPANIEAAWVQGLAQAVSAEAQGDLNPAGVNCFRSFAGRGLRLYGARTVSSDGLWRFVNVRRLMMMIEKSLDASLQWSVFEPADLGLRDSLVTAISGFLETIWQRGALAGTVAEEAFFVRCDDTNNPADEVDNGRLRIEVGVAPVRPAEFVVVRIGKTADSIELTETGAPDAVEAAA